MTTDEIRFYLQHRDQIKHWAALEQRVEKLVRDAVANQKPDTAVSLLKGESGDQEADLYIRNQALIREWDQLHTQAGQALHEELLAVGLGAGYDVAQGARDFSTVFLRSPEFDELGDRYGIRLLLFWMKRDLLSRGKFPYPRMALSAHKDTWEGQNRQALAAATRPVARDLGLKKKGDWYVHYGMLDPITGSQSLPEYAEQCLTTLQRAADDLYPVLDDAVAAVKDPD